MPETASMKGGWVGGQEFGKGWNSDSARCDLAFCKDFTVLVSVNNAQAGYVVEYALQKHEQWSQASHEQREI